DLVARRGDVPVDGYDVPGDVLVAQVGEVSLDGVVDLAERGPEQLERHWCASLAQYLLRPEYLRADLCRGKGGQVWMAPGVVEHQVPLAGLEDRELRIGRDPHAHVEEGGRHSFAAQGV